MNSEKLKILKMVQEGKLNAEDSLELLNALEETTSKPDFRTAGRFLRVRVNGHHAKKVNVNIPLNLLKVASKLAGFGMSFIPQEAREEMEKKGIDLTKLDIEELVDLIEQGLSDGKLVDIDVDDPEEGRIQVEVFVD